MNSVPKCNMCSDNLCKRPPVGRFLLIDPLMFAFWALAYRRLDWLLKWVLRQFRNDSLNKWKPYNRQWDDKPRCLFLAACYFCVSCSIQSTCSIISRDTLWTLRSNNGNVHENVAEEWTSHPFKLFRDYPKSPCYLKEGNFGWSWREEPRPSSDRGGRIFHLAVPVLK